MLSPTQDKSKIEHRHMRSRIEGKRSRQMILSALHEIFTRMMVQNCCQCEQLDEEVHVSANSHSPPIDLYRKAQSHPALR